MSVEYWQIPYVEDVLAYHNKKYGTDIHAVGRCEEIHPESGSRLNWDWVCRYRSKGSGIAVEVKRLENRELREKFSVLDQICSELSLELGG
jgi:hypothetical protein